MADLEIGKLTENQLTSLSFSAQPPLTSWLHLVVQKANKELEIKIKCEYKPHCAAPHAVRGDRSPGRERAGGAEQLQERGGLGVTQATRGRWVVVC